MRKHEINTPEAVRPNLGKFLFNWVTDNDRFYAVGDQITFRPEGRIYYVTEIDLLTPVGGVSLRLAVFVPPKGEELVRIYNGLPHDVLVLSEKTCWYDNRIRKMVTEDPEVLFCIPRGARVLSARFRTVQAQAINGVPVRRKELVELDYLPDGPDLFIVSQLFSEAYLHRHGQAERLYTPCNPVYTTDGRTMIGCLAISAAGDWK